MSSMELSISTLASMQFAATLKELPFACEASGPYSLGDIADNGWRISNGSFIVPDGPGFGLEIDEDKLRHYTTQAWVCDENSRVLD